MACGAKAPQPATRDGPTSSGSGRRNWIAMFAQLRSGCAVAVRLASSDDAPYAASAAAAAAAAASSPASLPPSATLPSDSTGSSSPPFSGLLQPSPAFSSAAAAPPAVAISSAEIGAFDPGRSLATFRPRDDSRARGIHAVHGAAANAACVLAGQPHRSGSHSRPMRKHGQLFVEQSAAHLHPWKRLRHEGPHAQNTCGRVREGWAGGT